MEKDNRFFYCYSEPMKNFLRSQGLWYITKAINPKTNTLFFMFDKSRELDFAIEKWNKVKEL
jgi:hypothetical protein